MSAEDRPWPPPPSPEVDPYTVPKVAAILDAGPIPPESWIFTAVCERDHPVVRVLVVDGRHLAIGRDTTIVHGSAHPRSLRWLPGPDGEWRPDRRGRLLGLWLDVHAERELYELTCRCGPLAITLPWLREQVAAGRRRRRLDLQACREIASA